MPDFVMSGGAWRKSAILTPQGRERGQSFLRSGILSWTIFAMPRQFFMLDGRR
ncbi:hypothetical protein HPQ64_08650 [Rhizobiales bacterium]|uniref:hypothetical protein n=1 Tax=Hongsoonwoonella zoysiae TaxID=2821844 RepID=UPI001560362C|nr:hypothetical protein [Hongsoonwoonella zoysiae]NRG17756.1 hypothetical protein [Hongsoonwoonella zoysiae]